MYDHTFIHHRQEYYEDESMRKLYTDVLERLLTAIYEEQEPDSPESMGHSTEILDEAFEQVPYENYLKESPEQILSGNKDESSWPPWPWPPWGPGEDPKTPSERAENHAKKIVALERSLAQATLDL
jgi:endothelin-converting enzyme